MAKVKYGGGVADMRNAFAGQVHSRNTYGNYIRQKVSPVQPRTPRQQQLRSQLSDLAKRYSTVLNDEQRNAWINFAAANPVVDVFGDSITLTGINMYQKVNNLRKLMGLSVLDNPPSDFSVQSPTSAGLTIDYEGTPPTLKIKVTFAPSPAPSNHRVEVWATEPLKPGVMFFSHKLRLLKISQANQSSPLDITDDYIDRFGTPAVGTKIGVEIRFVNENNGAQSRGLRATAIVPLPS
jgi:hypothetical protein